MQILGVLYTQIVYYLFNCLRIFRPCSLHFQQFSHSSEDDTIVSKRQLPIICDKGLWTEILHFWLKTKKTLRQRYLFVPVCIHFRSKGRVSSSSSSMLGRRLPTECTATFRGYCTNPTLVSPFHLQRRSTSTGVRVLYQRKVKLWARNVRSNLAIQ
jgi:hypothetical protein